MIPIEYLALRVIDASGATTSEIVLTDTVQYALASYAPTAATLRASTLGGQSEYEEAVDSLEVYAIGATAARAAANAEALAERLNQAARWRDGGDVQAVVIAARLQGSTVGTQIAVCLGPEPGQPPITIAPRLDVPVLAGQWTVPISINVRRRGLWYTESISSATDTFQQATSDFLASATFALESEARTPVAALLRLSTTTAVPAADALSDSVLIVTGSGATAGIRVEALSSDASPPTGFAIQADAANLPVAGTNVLRFNPATANPATTDDYNITAGVLPGTDRQIALFLTCRTNAVVSGLSFLLTPRISVASTVFSGRPVEVAATSTNTRLVPLGLITIPFRIGNVTPQFSLRVQAVGGTGTTLDIDAVLVVTLTEQTAIVQIPAVTLSSELAGDVYIAVDPCDVQGTIAESVDGAAQGVPGRGPLVYACERVGGQLVNPQPLAYLGSMPQVDGSAIYGTWFSVNPPYWVYTPSAARVLQSITYSRRLAYRTLQ